MPTPPRAWIPAEASRSADPLTGRTVTRWTSSPAKDQHLYFTTPSVTSDGRWLVLISERSGHPNLYGLERATGRMRPLTANASGTRRAYCYPYGGEAGLSKPTASLDPVRGRAFAVVDDQVIRADLESGESAPLAPLPERGMTAFTHVSPDGRWLCLPLTTPIEPFLEPAATQGEQMRLLWPHISAGRIETKLWLIDTETGAARVWATLPFWVTHVQFDPTGGGRAIFNSEGRWQNQAEIPRIWRIDAEGRTRPLFPQVAPERCGHENWAADGSAVVYHGDDDQGSYLARRDWEGLLLERLDVSDIATHHATPDATGRGYYVDARDGIIYHIGLEGGQRRLDPVCRHDTSDFHDQDNHVHPILAPDGRSLVFTSKRAGFADVYEVSLED
jgi:Tol biopolymer transport system component